MPFAFSPRSASSPDTRTRFQRLPRRRRTERRTRSDHSWRVLGELAALDLDRRTVVVFNADHGEILGDHDLLLKGGYFYDEVVHAPLILELLGIARPDRVQGRSLVPVIAGAERRTGAVYSEFPAMKMVRTRDWKLVHYVRAPYGEWYNLKEDPHELYNRWDDPACAAAKSEMQGRLADWLVSTEDPLLEPLKAEYGEWAFGEIRIHCPAASSPVPPPLRFVLPSSWWRTAICPMACFCFSGLFAAFSVSQLEKSPRSCGVPL